MGQINTNNYPIVDSLLDDDLLIVENATNGTGTTTPKQLRENAIGKDPLQTTARTVTGAINELKNSGALPETPLSIAHGGTGNTAGYIRTGALSGSTIGTKATAEGYNTTASGNYSHASGYHTKASGSYSHSSGYYTQAKYDSQTAIGKYNNNMSDTLFEVGNGTGSSAKSNALEVYSDGRVHTNKLVIGNDNQLGVNTVTGIAMGAGVTAGYENQVAVGVANNNRSDTLFEVGNGSLRGQHKNAFEVYSNGNIKAQGTVSDVNGTLNAVTANPSDTASTDLTKIKIGNTVYNISGGSGNTKVKTLYELYASSWSSAPNSDGFYTAQVTLNPTLNPDVVPEILLAGSSASAQPTDTFRTMFSYVERGYMSGSTLTLYAKTKPTSLFKFWVEGVSGSGSLAVACNVIQPNGAVSGGGSVLTPFTLSGNDRLSDIFGGYIVNGNKVTIDLFARVLVEPGNTFVFPDLTTGPMDTRIYDLPLPYKNITSCLNAYYLLYDSANNRYINFANGIATVYVTGNNAYMAIGKYSPLNIEQQNVYIRVYGDYKTN